MRYLSTLPRWTFLLEEGFCLFYRDFPTRGIWADSLLVGSQTERRIAHIQGLVVLISPYSITTWSTIQVMRIKEMITNDQMFWFLPNPPN